MEFMSEKRLRPKLDSIASLLKLHHSTRLFLALYVDRRVSPLLKIAAAGGMIYKFSPLDVEPDAITGIGLMDDIIVSLIIIQAFIEMAPDHVIDEKCERLGIDRDKAFVNVPQTIEDARELYSLAKKYGLGAARTVGNMAGAASQAGQEEPAPAPNTGHGDTGEKKVEKESPRYTGYSAFNRED